MNRNDFDRQFERYLNGELDGTEERELLDGIRGDARLEPIVHAETVMRRAIGRDRSAIPTDHAATRASVMAKLAGTAPAGPGHAGAPTDATGSTASAPSAGSGSIPSAGSSFVTGSSFLGALGAKLAIIGAILAVGAGIYLAASSGETPRDRVTTGAASAPLNGPSSTPDAASPASRAQAAPEVVTSRSVDTSERHQPKREAGAATSAPTPEAPSGDDGKNPREPTETSSASTPSEEVKPATTEPEMPADTAITRNRKARMKIHIGPPK